MVHKVFAGATVAVQCKQNLVRFCVVVVLGQGDKVFAAVAAYLDLELVAIFDALDLLQLGVAAAALTRGRLVADVVAEFERRFRRDGLCEFHIECRVERSERHGECVKAIECKAERFALGGVFHESAVACLGAERLAVVAIGCELDVLLGVTDGDLCKVCAACFETFAQVVSAGSLQSLLEDLVAERVVNLYLDRRCAALGVGKYAVVDADVADGVLVCRVDAHVFVFVDGELTFVIGLCGLAFLEQAYIDVLEGLALVVGDFSANRVGE